MFDDRDLLDPLGQEEGTDVPEAPEVPGEPAEVGEEEEDIE